MKSRGFKFLSVFVCLWALLSLSATEVSAKPKDFYVKVDGNIQMADSQLQFEDEIERIDTGEEDEDGRPIEDIIWHIRVTDDSLIGLLDEAVETPDFERDIENGEAGFLDERLTPRPTTDEELIIDFSLWILTGLSLIYSRDTYDFANDYRLTTIRGLFLFVIPVTTHFLYRNCNGEQHLVATSAPPPEDREDESRLVDLRELSDVCNGLEGSLGEG